MPRIAMVAAALWDLRAQCEQQLRAITDAQRLIDRYRDSPHAQDEAKRRLHADLEMVVQAHANVGEALKDCESVINLLPACAPDGTANPAT